MDNNKIEKDPLYDEALRIIKEKQEFSADLVSEELDIGYARSVRILEQIKQDSASRDNSWEIFNSLPADKKIAVLKGTLQELMKPQFIMFFSGCAALLLLIIIFVDLMGNRAVSSSYSTTSKGILVSLVLIIVPPIRPFIYSAFFILIVISGIAGVLYLQKRKGGDK